MSILSVLEKFQKNYCDISSLPSPYVAAIGSDPKTDEFNGLNLTCEFNKVREEGDDFVAEFKIKGQKQPIRLSSADIKKLSRKAARAIEKDLNCRIGQYEDWIDYMYGSNADEVVASKREWVHVPGMFGENYYKREEVLSYREGLAEDTKSHIASWNRAQFKVAMNALKAASEYGLKEVNRAVQMARKPK